MLTLQSTTVKRLLKWKKEGVKQSDKWCEKAVGVLAKNLSKPSLKDLETALSVQDANTMCVIFPSSLSSSIPGHYTGTPHVVYCKLWRWPDLESHLELNPYAHCQFGYGKKYDVICINPYHYQRLQHLERPHLVQQSVLSALQYSFGSTGSLASYAIASKPNQTETSTASQSAAPPPQASPELPRRNMGAPSLNVMLPTDCHGYVDILDALPRPFDYAINYANLPHWCSITYYELSSRVGEPFHGSSGSIIVDGFTDPYNAERFCLGVFANFNRTEMVERARGNIGKGVRFYYFGESVYVECLSNCSIFIQSVATNNSSGWDHSTVCKISPGCIFKLFSYKNFVEEVIETYNGGYDQVNKLSSWCTIRLSFVKGWGKGYQKDQITMTPCWIEVHLNGPSQWLDNILCMMGPPQSPCKELNVL